MPEITNTVEVHTGSDSCAAECSHCPFTGDFENKENKIEDMVAKTFAMLQECFARNNEDRNLSYAFALKGKVSHPMPEILHPGSVRHLQIGIGKMTEEHQSNIGKTVDETMEKLTYLLQSISNANIANTNLDTDKRPWLQFVITPRKMFIDKFEYEFFNQFFPKFKPFIVDNKYGYGEITFDSNMLPGEQLQKSLPVVMKEKNIFENYFREYINSDLNNFDYLLRAKEQCDDVKDEGKVIMGYSVGVIQKNCPIEFAVARRLMGRIKKGNMEEYYNVARDYFVDSTNSYASLYSHGVLLHHSSFQLQNPFLRVTHERMQDILQSEWIYEPNDKDQNPYLTAVNRLILENIAVYKETGDVSNEQKELVAKSELHKSKLSTY